MNWVWEGHFRGSGSLQRQPSPLAGAACPTTNIPQAAYLALHPGPGVTHFFPAGRDLPPGPALAGGPRPPGLVSNSTSRGCWGR